MVLLAFIGRFNANTKNKCKVQVGGVGVNIQKLRWVGYSVHLNGVSQTDQRDTTDAQNNAIVFEGHQTPNQLMVNIDILSSNQLHVGTPATFDQAGGNFTQRHPYSQALPLALDDSLVTTKFGLGDTTFTINKRIHKDIEIEVLKFDDKGELVPMDTDAPAITTSDKKKTGSVQLQSIILYFQYDFVSYF